MRPHIPVCLSLALAALSLGGCQPVQAGSAESGKPQPGRQRQVLLAADVTLPVPLLRQARRVSESVIEALGPGDQLLLVRLSSGRFEPERAVVAAVQLPALDIDLVTPARTMDEWRRRQTALAQLRGEVRAEQAELVSTLDRLLAPAAAGRRGTPVHDLFRYLAAVPELVASEQRVLIVISDLYNQDETGRGTQAPPEWRLPFDGAAVHLLFVPDIWREGTAGQAWQTWLGDCGAARTVVLDAALSAGAKPLPPREPPSMVPRRGF